MLSTVALTWGLLEDCFGTALGLYEEYFGTSLLRTSRLCLVRFERVNKIMTKCMLFLAYLTCFFSGENC